ncbi:MAG: hypothetical protein ACK561_10735 [Pseudomonadaceae bacterium]
MAGKTMQKDHSNREQRISQVAQMLRSAALERGIHVTPDGRVGEIGAAQLLELQPASLKGLRNCDKGPSFYYRGAGNGSKISYRIDDLAIWLEQGRVGV